LNPESVTEGTTRLLDTPEPQASFDPNAYERPGGLAQATSPIHPQAQPTNRSLEAKKAPTNWLLLGSIIVVGLILTGVLIMLWNRPAATPAPPQIVIKRELPPIQPPPQPPPPPGVATQGSSIDRAWIYPGAETMMEMRDVSKGNFLQLQSSDSMDKIVKWYTEKIKPTRIIRETDSNIILVGAEMTAIINAEGERTIIMLKQGGI